MKLKIHFSILFALAHVLSLAQSPGPEEKDELVRSVYSAVLNDFCQETTTAFVIEDSTRNYNIYRWDYRRYFNVLDQSWMYNQPPFAVDSAWIPFLQALDAKKTSIKKTRIPEFESIAKVYVLSKDTIAARRQSQETGNGMFRGMGWMKAKIELSDVLLSDNGRMAIVEFSEHCGSLCGSGSLILLQKDSANRWKVVYKIGTWIS